MQESRSHHEPFFGDTVWELPPLILHPVGDRAASQQLLENSREALALSGVLPGGGVDPEALQRRLLESRCVEIRMLYYLGRDLTRWIGQCMECVARIPALRNAGIGEQSFARLLTIRMPAAVARKLEDWGVHDAGVLFTRALGLNQIFREPPDFEGVAEEFVRSYHRYADALFLCWQQVAVFREITEANFRFELYASAEYSRMLEAQWGTT